MADHPHISPPPWMCDAPTARLWAALEATGGEARFVGGCVRDALLGRPVSDFDVACTLLPEATLQALETAGIKAIPTGMDHGTVTAIADGVHFEVTTLREDVACDGRHADVAFTTQWQTDAARRDFTMNALFATPDGQIYDYYGGIEDAKSGRVRFIGDARARIAEDALRILRFFRFFAHYGQGEMDETARAACVAEGGRLEILSGERIQTEMFKLLGAPNPAPVLLSMAEGGLLSILSLPVTPRGMKAIQRLLALEVESDAITRLSVLVRACENPVEVRAGISHKWRFSNNDSQALSQLVTANLTAISQWPEMEQKKAIRRVGTERFIQMLHVAWAEETKPDAAAFHQALTHAQNWQIPNFPLKGGDLIAAGLVEKGPKVGAMLAQLEAQWEAAEYRPTAKELLATANDL